MKSLRILRSLGVALFFIIFLYSAASAEMNRKGRVGIGTDIGLGGATEVSDSSGGAFALGVHIDLQYFIANQISFQFRSLWERYYYKFKWEDDSGHHTVSAPMDVFPFIFGVRFYFASTGSLNFFTGVGGGFSFYSFDHHVDFTGDNTEMRLLLDFQLGAEYEVNNNLGLRVMFDVLVPNLLPTDHGEDVIGRFMLFFGASYYFGS